MKTFGGVVRLSFLLRNAAPIFVGAALCTQMIACADENDPKTWVKRLDDPAQRSTAVKRLSDYFNDQMTKSGNDRDKPEIKALLDVIVEPMTKVYTAGTLDEKTRKELMKTLADTRDPRTTPALAKAFSDYEPGKNDEDVKFAAQSVNGMATAGKLTDQGVIDALWTVFSKFQVSKAKSIELVKALHEAVLAVKSPSYGPKAVEKLGAAVTPDVDSQKDQIQFWQLTSIQVIKLIKYVPAVKPLVTVLLTPSKSDLRATASSALLTMGKDAEPVLLAAFNGTDPDLAKLAFADKTHLTILADTLGSISRPGGKDAILKALPAVDNDTNRRWLTTTLVKFPTDSRTIAAFEDAYKKMPSASNEDIAARGAVAQATSQFYDATVVDFLLKEIAGAKGDNASALQIPALEAAIKLMVPAQKEAVGAAVAKLTGFMAKNGTETERGQMGLIKGLYDASVTVLGKCGQDAACYSKVLDEPVVSGAGGNSKAIKAAWMAAMYGNDATRLDLTGKVANVKNPGARLALVEAIDHLAPKGDAVAAGALEKVVEADTASGNKDLQAGDDVVVKVALRLRARS